jgi:hypothetical protein
MWGILFLVNIAKIQNKHLEIRLFAALKYSCNREKLNFQWCCTSQNFAVTIEKANFQKFRNQLL